MSVSDQETKLPTKATFPVEGTPVVRLEGVSKKYWKGMREIDALIGVSLVINKGELVTIQGPSGCGKTTLLNMIGMMDTPTSGSIFINEQKVGDMNDNEKSEMIANNIGFVFQFYNLINQYTALENVSIAPGAKGIRDDKKRKEMALKALEKVGLSDRVDNSPGELSGGEQQRVTIARAIINDPTILIADEPTGDLDKKTGQKIMDIFKKLNDEGRTILIVTHDQNIGAQGKRRIKMEDYRIVSDEGGSIPDKTSPVQIPYSEKEMDKMYVKKTSKKEIEEEKKRKDVEESERKASEVQISKIKELIGVSERIKIEDIADILRIKRKDVIQKIVPLAKNMNVQISGDFFIVKKDSTNAFVDEIEKQFTKWGKDGKI